MSTAATEHPHMHDPKIEREKDRHWKRGRAHVDDVLGAGGFNGYISEKSSRIREARKAFETLPTCVYCMDERAAMNAKNGVYVAGSGILLKDNPQKRAAFIEECKRLGVTDTTLHPGCGAVALYAKQKGISVKQAEQDAKDWARTLARKLGGRYRGEVRIEPKDFHVAQGAYYDSTNKFNPGNAPDIFPTGFVVSRGVVSAEDALAELNVGAGIALGDHGYGNRFTRKNKFMVTVIARSPEEADKGEREIMNNATLPHELITINKYIAP